MTPNETQESATQIMEEAPAPPDAQPGEPPREEGEVKNEACESEGEEATPPSEPSEVKSAGDGAESSSPEPAAAEAGGTAAATGEEAAPAAPLGFGGPSGAELAVFCRQLATLTESGVPALDCFQTIARRTGNPRLRKAVEATARGIAAGRTIHEAAAPQARVFSPLAVGLIQAGEASGRLPESLARLAGIMESKARIERRMAALMLYPAIALAVAIGALSLILVKAIPVFKSVHGQTELPRITQFVFDLSNFTAQTWWVLLPAIGLGLAGGCWWARSTPGGARFLGGLALRLPVLGGLGRKIAAARLARTLGGLAAAGMPLADALAIAADASENRLTGEALRRVRGRVRRGERMAEPLAREGVLPPLAVDMIGIGEETGTLDRMLSNVADLYDEEVDAALGGLASIIEPILIIVLGGAIFFIGLAALLPYFRLTEAIQEQ